MPPNPEITRKKVMKVYLKYLQTHENLPTHVEIEKLSGVSKITVAKVLNNIKIGDYTELFKIHTVAIMDIITQKAKEGSHKHQELFLKYVWPNEVLDKNGGTAENAPPVSRFVLWQGMDIDV